MIEGTNSPAATHHLSAWNMCIRASLCVQTCLPSAMLQGSSRTWEAGKVVDRDRQCCCWRICCPWVYTHSWRTRGRERKLIFFQCLFVRVWVNWHFWELLWLLCFWQEDKVIQAEVRKKKAENSKVTFSCLFFHVVLRSTNNTTFI